MTVAISRPKEVAHDETPAIISDHPFVPRGEWWSLCKHCGLAMPAHAETTIDPRDYIWKIGYVGDDDPVDDD